MKDMKTKDLKKRLRKAALACISAMTLFSSILPGTVPFSPVPVSAAEGISVHSTGVSGAYEEMIQYKDADAGHIVYQIDADRFNLKNADLSSFTSSNDNFKMGTSPLIWNLDQMQTSPSIPKGRAIYYAGEMPVAFIDNDNGGIYRSTTIHPTGNCSIRWRNIVRGSDGQMYDLKMTVGIDDLIMYDWVWYYKVYNKDTFFFRREEYIDEIQRLNANVTDDKLLSFPEWFPDYRDIYIPDYWHTEYWPKRTTIVYDWPLQSDSSMKTRSMVTSPVAGFGMHANFTFQVLCHGSDTAAPEGKVLYGISDLDAWSYGRVKGGQNAYAYYAEGVNLNAGIQNTYVNAGNGLAIYNNNKTYCRNNVTGDATHEGWNTGLTFLGNSTGFSFSSSDSLHASSLFDLPKDNQYSITASASGMGTISPEGTNAYAENDFTGYHIEADTDCIIERIAVDGKTIYRWDKNLTYADADNRLVILNYGSAGHASAANFLFGRIMTDHKIQVSFRDEVKEQTWSVTSSCSPAGGGTIDSSINAIKQGESCTIHYQPSGGWYIDQITADGTTVDADRNPLSYTFTDIRENHTLDVHYVNDTVMTLHQKVSDATSGASDIHGTTVQPGTELKYTASYKNNTNRTAAAVISAPVPAQTSLISIGNSGSYDNGTIRWNVDKISPGAAGEVSFTVRVKDDAASSGIETKSKAEVTIAGSDIFLVTSNTVSNHTPACSLTISGAAGDDSGKTVEALGQTMNYRISVRNTTDTSETFTIRDRIPEGSVYVDSDGTYANGEVVWTLTLAPGEEREISLSLKAENPGRYSHTFRIFCDNNPVDSVTLTNDVYAFHVDCSLSDSSSSDSSRKLAGVGFLLKDSKGRYYRMDKNGTVSWGEESLAAEQFSDEKGNVTFSGMSPGTYTLVEKTTPSGYTPVNQEITVSVEEGSYEQTVRMPHKSVIQLPSAGGPGILLFLIIAAALTVAGVIIDRKRKRQ